MKEAIIKLHDQIEKAIKKVSKEHKLTYSEVIGLMEMIKSDLIDQAKEEDE